MANITHLLKLSGKAIPIKGIPIIAAYFKTYVTTNQAMPPLPILAPTIAGDGNSKLTKIKIIPGSKHNKNAYK